MENKRSVEYYDSCVRDVKLEDITSSEYNAKALRKPRDNDQELTSIFLTNSADEYSDYFVVTNNDDMGWLGYFIGRNSQLKELFIWEWLEGDSDHSKIDAFTQGISLNKSITRLRVDTVFGELLLQHLGQFFRNNNNLVHLELSEFDIGLESTRKLAVMLRDGMSLESFHVERLCYDSVSDSFIDDGVVTAEVMSALSMHTKLVSVQLWKCNLDRSDCMALGRLSSLKVLNLLDSNVDDEGMKALVGAMEIDTALEVLNLSENTSITAKGLSSLSSLLQSDKCRLRQLVLFGIRIRDDGAVVIAEPWRVISH